MTLSKQTQQTNAIQKPLVLQGERPTHPNIHMYICSLPSVLCSPLLSSLLVLGPVCAKLSRHQELLLCLCHQYTAPTATPVIPPPAPKYHLSEWPPNSCCCAIAISEVQHCQSQKQSCLQIYELAAQHAWVCVNSYSDNSLVFLQNKMLESSSTAAFDQVAADAAKVLQTVKTAAAIRTVYSTCS